MKSFNRFIIKNCILLLMLSCTSSGIREVTYQEELSLISSLSDRQYNKADFLSCFERRQVVQRKDNIIRLVVENEVWGEEVAGEKYCHITFWKQANGLYRGGARGDLYNNMSHKECVTKAMKCLGSRGNITGNRFELGN